MTLGMQKYGRKEGKTTKNKRKQQKKYFGFYQELIFSMRGRGGGRGHRSPRVLFPAFPRSLDHRMVWVKNNPVPTPPPTDRNTFHQTRFLPISHQSGSGTKSCLLIMKKASKTALGGNCYQSFTMLPEFKYKEEMAVT